MQRYSLPGRLSQSTSSYASSLMSPNGDVEIKAEKGAPNGYAALDAAGEIASTPPASFKRNISVQLEAADIIGMNVTPVTLIDAPGADKMVVLENVVFEMNRTSTAFTDGGAVNVYYAGGSASLISSTVAATVVTGAAGRTVSIRKSSDLADATLSDCANKAVKITNATGAFANGTGYMVVHLSYRVVDCPVIV